MCVCMLVDIAVHITRGQISSMLSFIGISEEMLASNKI